MSVQFDVLDDILSAIRIEATVHYLKNFSGDWGVQAERSPFKKFHVIVRGQCWLQADFLDAPLALYAGDIIAFPHGDSYQLSAEIDSPCIAEASLSQDDEAVDGIIKTGIVFGHIAFLNDLNHPFVRNLPRLLHVQAEEARQLNWIRTVADMLVTETKSGLPGSQSVVKRLAEVLHLYTLRAYILSQQEDGKCASVFKDPSLYRALQLIHENPAESWTLEQIARQVGLSRTLFATRFRELVGMTPMRYITMWRMQKAKSLLESSDLTLAIVAERIGYASEAAFSRAFQREFGITPGRSR